MLTTLKSTLKELRRQADCSRRQVGCVLVRDGQVVGRGSNGLPAGSCTGGDCPRGRLSYEEQPAFVGYAETGCTSVHAEVAAITDAGDLASGSVAYVTCPPCDGCAAALKAAGVRVTLIVP